jgi:hypothetical protein
LAVRPHELAAADLLAGLPAPMLEALEAGARRRASEIRRQSGRHFDPDLVPVFVAMVEAG